MREILTIPNSILRQECKPIEEIDSTIKELAEEMIDLLGHKQKGLTPVGIAAPQLGVLVRMFVYRVSPRSDMQDARIVINPTLTLKGKIIQLSESCLSIPGRRYLIRRYKLAKLMCVDINGEYHSYKESGMLAQMFQHEVDHLNGILIDIHGMMMV